MSGCLFCNNKFIFFFFFKKYVLCVKTVLCFYVFIAYYIRNTNIYTLFTWVKYSLPQALLIAAMAAFCCLSCSSPTTPHPTQQGLVRRLKRREKKKKEQRGFHIFPHIKVNPVISGGGLFQCLYLMLSSHTTSHTIFGL